MIRRILFILAAALMLLSSCQARPQGAIPMQVSVVVGSVEIKKTAAKGFEPLLVGQLVETGDLLQSTGTDSYAEIRGARTFFVLGPNASARVTQLSTSPDLTTQRLELTSGTLLAAAEEKLGQGYFEVDFLKGSAVIHGSAMMISTDIRSSMGNTIVTCLQGETTFNSAGGSQQLSTGQTMSVGMNGTVTNPIDTMDEKIRERDPDAYAIMSDKYLKYFPEMWATFTPRPSETPTPKKSSTPTRQATITPFPTFETSTPSTVVAAPTFRPSVTLPSGFTGLTPEELANQGTFTYDVTCESYTTDCVCDSALATPVVELMIRFDDAGVMLGQFKYEKTFPNVYQFQQGDQTARVDFLPEGWEFLLIKNGSICTVQTFTRR